MEIHIHIHHEGLESIVEKLNLIIQNQNKIMATINDSFAALLDKVTAQTTRIESLSTLTAGIKAQLDAVLSGVLNEEQQTQVDAIFAKVDENSAKIDTAINANDSDPNT